jgi:hypothetical protein
LVTPLLSAAAPIPSRMNVIHSSRNTTITAAVVRNDAIHM